MKHFDKLKMCKQISCVIFLFKIKNLEDLFCWTSSLLARGDEISVVPCAYVDRSFVADANLKVDDQGMMKKQKDLENS